MKRAVAADWGTAAPAPARAGGGWLVWLGPCAGAPPDPARTGLEPARPTVTLGRCLIVLPTDGEPFSSAGHDACRALFSGHLLNREELCRRLELPASPPPTEAAILLAAYAAWGEALAHELEGAYAALVWEPARDMLLAVRDPNGQIPLYYARAGGGLVLSSDIWTLLRHPEVSREIDRLVVAEHLLDRLSRVEETFFARVRRVPGGHWLASRGGEVALRRYWDPCPPGEPIAWLTREEVGQFPAVMRREVERCLAVGPAAISLSAGIDSVSVAAFAAEVARERGWPVPHGLSLHFAGPMSDESAGQRGVAEALGMPFQLLTLEECLGGRPLLDAALELSPAFPSPAISLWEPLWIALLEQARRRGLQVVLTGEGGDEWLGITPLLAAELIRRGDLIGLWRLYRACLNSHPLSPRRFARALFWRHGVRQVLRDAACRRFPGWVARRRRPVELPDWVAPDPELRRQLRERLQPPPPAPPIDSAYVRDLRPSLQHPIVMIDLEEIHYRARGRGVSYFHPYWSRPVVEFLLRTPPLLLLEGGQTKGIARQFVGERLPDLGLDQRRKVTTSQFRQRMVLPCWARIWARWRNDSALARMGVVDEPCLDRALRRAAAAGRVEPVHLWLSSEAWLRGQS